MKRLIIAGGTGFLGTVLQQYFKNRFSQIIILTRGKTVQRENVKYVHWDGVTISGWESYLDHADVLINLTGKSVDCRYHQKNKAIILNSRIDATKVLQRALEKCENPPSLWINSSTATIYRHSEDTPMTEEHGEIGDDFSMNVAKKWEHSFFKDSLPKTRKVAMRTSIVMGRRGGAFIPLKNLTKLGFGGKQGNGNQMISWIHETDFARAVDHIIRSPDLSGVINVTAPKPVKNRVFMGMLRKASGTIVGIPLPAFLLKIGAFFIRTETELVLKSRFVIPSKLLASGFQFTYKHPEAALVELVSKS
ncbi:TIGR01777 family oxidoreductase [Flavobacteriaceae bacterium M23B6Z8]